LRFTIPCRIGSMGCTEIAQADLELWQEAMSRQ
jgi:hypothetical protein